jgi:hypothetical protein
MSPARLAELVRENEEDIRIARETRQRDWLNSKIGRRLSLEALERSLAAHWAVREQK